MRVHLTQYDVIALRQRAAESSEFADDGESFAEEALACFGEEEIDAIESSGGVPADDFLMSVFTTWEGGHPEAIIETLETMLGEHDIELTYDEADFEEDYVDAWPDGDVDVPEADEFEQL